VVNNNGSDDDDEVGPKPGSQQVCFMNIVRVFSLFVVALGQPWRSSVCSSAQESHAATLPKTNVLERSVGL
jgi:hypothetical protein